MEKCNICPRNCNISRDKSYGFCKSPEDILISKHMLHKWEEPCISGERGAGTIFFSGCNLRCVYCQNKRISRGGSGIPHTDSEILGIIRGLADSGAECIELVTPTHYTKQLIPILEAAKKEIDLPLVWNCGGYESVETLRSLDGLIDVYMPDIKYYSSELSAAYSSAKDYFPTAMAALSEMLRQVGKPNVSERGILRRGVIVRHLVLPGCREDSIKLLRALNNALDSPSDVILSLMSQYTPDFYDISDGGHKNLTRKVTSFEYSSVLRVANELGFDGYFQDKSSANSVYTPDF